MRQVSAEQAQQATERVFFVWGLPARVRFDNGPPFGTTKDRALPSGLVLWLVSLGMEVIFNRPYSPWQNGSVECTQRISSRWANPASVSDTEQLQRVLDQVAYEHLRVARQRVNGDRTRLELYPELRGNHRKYDPEDVDPAKVKDYLLRFSWARKVYGNGRIGIFGQTWTVGNQYRHQPVQISLDPDINAWRVTLPNGKTIKTLMQMDLSKKAIKNLTVFQRT